MSTLLQSPTHTSGPCIADVKAAPAPCFDADAGSSKIAGREAFDAAAAAASGCSPTWTIRAAAGVPSADAEPTVLLPFSLSLTLDLELTAEEAQWLVQPPAPPAGASSSATQCAAPRTSTAARAMLRRAATSLGTAGKRLACTASGSMRRLRSTLAATTCLSPRRTPALEPFTPSGEGWTKTHVNWS